MNNKIQNKFKIIRIMSIIFLMFLITLLITEIYFKINKKEIIDFEKYMLSVQTEYNEVTIPFFQEGGIVQGTIEGKGMIDWKASMSIIQFLNSDLTFGEEEEELLKNFKNANLLQIIKDNTYEEEQENEEEKQSVITEQKRYLIVENPNLEEYIEWCNNNFEVINTYKKKKSLETDLSQTKFTEEEIKEIRKIYENNDFYKLFSDEFNSMYAYVNVVIEDEQLQAIYDEFLKNAGTRYWINHNNLNYDTCMDYYDCSSWILHVWAHIGIIELGNMSASDIYVYHCMKIPVEERKAGDLIFLKSTYDSQNVISHVGIYMGELTIDGETAEWVIDTGGNPKGVKISKYDNGFWNGEKFYVVGRLKEK